MGRKKIEDTEVVYARIPITLGTRLRADSEKDGRTISELIKRALLSVYRRKDRDVLLPLQQPKVQR
jgi:hypothetical protein